MQIDTIIIPRSLAIERGLTKYFTGVACASGHIDWRATISSTCLECRRASNRKARKAWTPEQRAKSRDSGLRWIEKDRVSAWATMTVNGCRARASAKGIPFDLTKEHLVSISTVRCPALGCDLVYVNTDGRRKLYNSASIDRIRPALGYVIGNVVIISSRANAIKSDAQQHEVSAVANWMFSLGLGNAD